MDAMLLFKASLLLSATLLGARLLRRAPAVTRHRLWTSAFAAVLALPFLVMVVPSLYVPVPAARLTSRPYTVGVADTSAAPAFARATAGRHSDGSPASSMAPPESRLLTSPGRARPSARTLLLTAWVGGTLAATAALLLSLLRVRRLARTADDMADAAWTASAATLGARLGLKRAPRLFVSAAVGTPMAGGAWRPAIFLPAAARDWNDEHRDVVLAHEIAHLAGHDPLRHVAARLAVAVYWFHPLAWMAARQSAAAREQACDEAVLALGTRPSAYARVLLDLAESLEPSTRAVAALPMVERSHLETRVMAILNDEIRVTTRRSVLVPAAGVAICTLVLASMQPAAQASQRALVITAPAASAVVAAPPAPMPATPATAAAAAPFQVSGESACDWDRSSRSSSFRGRTDTRVVGGRTVVNELIGMTDVDRVIQTTLGDRRVCMLIEGAGPPASSDRPSFWFGRARRVVLEARRGSETQRLEVGPYGTGQRVSWQVGGKDRAFDAAAEQWRDRMLETLDSIWAISELRGEVSNLRGEISNIRGEASNLRGEISNLHGHVSNLRGEISNTRGEESNLRGEISNIRGHVSNLRGAISNAQGNISSLRAGGYRSDDSARTRDLVTRYENDIAKIEREIRDYAEDAKVAAVERRIAALDADKKVAAIEADIRTFDVNGKVAALERRIAGLDVDGKIARLEKEIAALDVDRKERELEKRRDEGIKRLEAAIAAIR